MYRSAFDLNVFSNYLIIIILKFPTKMLEMVKKSQILTIYKRKLMNLVEFLANECTYLRVLFL